MGIRNWADFLDKDFYDKETHRCHICGEKIGPRYIGSHFRQTHTEITLHQEAVRKFDAQLKRTFASVIKDYGYKLKEQPDPYWGPIWETARRYVGSEVW
jgi:hypothetical protein